MSKIIDCVMLEPTELFRKSLRRYTCSDKVVCPQNKWGHNANVTIAEAEEDPETPAGCNGRGTCVVEKDDPRWPKKCELCDYVFTDDDQWQFNSNRLFRDPRDGKLYRLREAPPGAMWFADWMPFRAGPDGHTLIVQTPGGEWNVDGPCTNCAKPGEKHHCWEREGVPPKVTVKPGCGKTCSIKCGNYHGHLVNGQLVAC